MSRHSKAAIPRKRYVKIQGLSYSGSTCPAHLKRKKLQSGASEVKYLAKHFCHTNKLKHLGHLPFNEEDRKWFAGKLSLGVPAAVIIRQARLNYGRQLTRSFLVTRQDLGNIAVSFGIARPERRHSNDSTSIEAFVCSLSSSHDCPIILYKRESDSHIHIGPTDANADGLIPDEFLLGYMDTSQCEMLKLHGVGERSVVCCDSTHGTNQYRYIMTTVMVMDDNRQGFPVAFLFSKKETEPVLEIVFQSHKGASRPDML